MNDIFNKTKYTRWYYTIIEKRSINEEHHASEVHHIIPRSLGGTDDPMNLVRLNYHDHAWCHWLLTKMTTGPALAKMRYAFNMMNVGGDHMGRVLDSKIVRAYTKNREELIKQHSEFMRGRTPWNKGKKLEGDQYKGGKKNKGRKHSEDTKKLIGSYKLGCKQSETTKEKRSKSMTGFLRGAMPEDEKLKRSLANKGKPKSVNHGKNVALANIGKISINRDGVEKKINQEELNYWINEGWNLGGKTRKIKQ